MAQSPGHRTTLPGKRQGEMSDTIGNSRRIEELGESGMGEV
jgi:hypothetical protein